MRIIFDNYTYGLIKTSYLKFLIITDEEYNKLKVIKDSNELIQKLERYFPTISELKELNLVSIEKKLLIIYFKIISKLIPYFPIQYQSFLKNILERFEIWNVKMFIMGKLINLDEQKLKDEIFLEVERILDRNKFIQKLLSCNSIDDAIDFLKKQDKYKDVIERGWEFYNKTKEIFLLENLLDKLFVERIMQYIEDFKGKERILFEIYVDTLIERYNLVLIFRGIKNKINFELLNQLIVPKINILTLQELQYLAQSSDEKEFINRLNNIEKKHKMISINSKFWVENIYLYKLLEFKKKSEIIQYSTEDPLTGFILQLNRRLINILNAKGEFDIKYMAIKNSLNLILRKEIDVYKVLKLFVKIFHKIEN